MVKCSECGKEFETERGMKIHKSRVHEETKKESKEEKWYRRREKELGLIMIIGIAAIIMIAISFIPFENILEEENELPVNETEENGFIDNETDTNDTKDYDLNETNGNVSYEDLYRPRNNTLYLICNFENKTVYEEYCEFSHRVATRYTGEEGIDYRRYDITNENAIDIMKGIGFGRYPLWVYNTEKTPKNEYCWGIGSAEQTPLNRFISECEEVGKYVP
ncbi:MAG: hypothetical protein ACOCTT_02375 [archaeon]